MLVFREDIVPILSKSKSLPRRLKVIFFSSERCHGFNGVRGSGVCLHRSFPNLISNIIVDNKKQMLVDEEHYQIVTCTHITRYSNYQIGKGWLAITRLKQLSLFIYFNIALSNTFEVINNREMKKQPFRFREGCS